MVHLGAFSCTLARTIQLPKSASSLHTTPRRCAADVQSAQRQTTKPHWPAAKRCKFLYFDSGGAAQRVNECVALHAMMAKTILKLNVLRFQLQSKTGIRDWKEQNSDGKSKTRT